MIFISILLMIMAISLPSINKNISFSLFSRITSIILIYAGALSLNALYIHSIGSGIGVYNGYFNVTILSQFFDFFMFLTASIVLISFPLIKSNELMTRVIGSVNNSYNQLSLDSRFSAYSIIILFSILGSTFLVSSADLLSIYLSIELQSFGVYILPSLFKNSIGATGASLKYFLLGGLSSCLILLGAGLIYSYTGLTSLDSIYSLLSLQSTSSLFENNNLLLDWTGINYNSGQIINEPLFFNLIGIEGFSLGLIIMVVGFLFKISAAPLHNWSPEVYHNSPTNVTIWLTIMPKISILILLLEMYTGGQLGSVLDPFTNLTHTLYSGVSLYTPSVSTLFFKNLLLISSLLSLVIGTVVGLAQKELKRLLAYSTISHIGFILLALAINTEQSIESFIFYIIQYTVTNLNVFLIILYLGYITTKLNNVNSSSKILNSIHNKEELEGLSNSSKSEYETEVDSSDIKKIRELEGTFNLYPILSISFCICIFSMAGIPPLIGFFSKQFVLFSAVENGYYFLSFIGIITSVISASYYLKLVKFIVSADTYRFSMSNDLKVENKISLDAAKISNLQSFTISVLTLSIILFVIKPSIILNSVQLLSLSLFMV